MYTTAEKLLMRIDEQATLFNKKLPKPKKNLRVCIAIPAKNEEDYLPRTLKALQIQQKDSGDELNKNLFEVLVLCHNCTDNTYAETKKFKQSHPDFNLHVIELNSEVINNIGSARRVLMHISAERLLGKDGWIASTDADTLPNSNWIDIILKQPQSVDMVCGKINVNTSHLGKDVKRLLKAKQKYNHFITELENLMVPDLRDSLPKHNHHSGPNMALRTHVYVTVEGIPPIAFLEDIQLFNSVKSMGYTIRHSNSLEVETSGRLHSKTACGLGSELTHWTNEDVTYRVEGVETLKRRFRIYKAVKELFFRYNPNNIDKISELGLIPKSKVEQIYHHSAIHEQMIIALEETLDNNISWNELQPKEDIFLVNPALQNYIYELTSLSFAKE